MAIQPTTPSSLDLTISIPGFSSSPNLLPGGGCFAAKDLDINQVPSRHGEDEWITANMDDEEEMNTNGCAPRKKLRLTKEQSLFLEESFRQNHTLNPKEALATQLKLRPRQIEVWFQNRRARSKLKQTETECEYLKRWFGSLTEQNRKLQSEVEELRAMKVDPPTVISPHSCEPMPASTLTMCPRCERVTTTMHDKGPAKATTSTAVVSTLSPKVASSILQLRQSWAAC